jgi:hypothetical protein
MNTFNFRKYCEEKQTVLIVLKCVSSKTSIRIQRLQLQRGVKNSLKKGKWTRYGKSHRGKVSGLYKSGPRDLHSMNKILVTLSPLSPHSKRIMIWARKPSTLPSSCYITTASK